MTLMQKSDTSLTITTFSDLLRIVETRPAWRRKMAKALFPDIAEAVFGVYLSRGREVASLVGERLYDAVDAGTISAQEREKVVATDLLWGGQLHETKEEVILIVQVSWLAEETDVARATECANILRKTGLKALPVVVAREWAEDIHEMARECKVVMVTSRHIDGVSWQSALAQ